MTSIGLISDTHGYLDPAIFEHFKNCDEVWHAGDFGDMELVKKLQGFKPLRGVYGNIDDKAIRNIFEEKLFFTCEEVPVMMQHIGGYPGRYAPGVKKEIILQHSQLFISGHSHILKVMYQPQYDVLHMNPGACGVHGFHQIKTVLRFVIDGSEIKDLAVIELGKRV